MNPNLLEVVHGRANPHIDPHLHIWGWEIPAYLFLGGIVAGIMIWVAVMEFRSGRRPPSRAAGLMPFAALALLSLGMLFLFLDLEYPAHVLRFYFTFQITSAMSWGSWILMAVYPALFLLGVGSLSTRDRDLLLQSKIGQQLQVPKIYGFLESFSQRHRRGILWTNVVAGISLGIYTGLLLGTMAARPLWSSSILGPLFLVSGLSTGAAFMMLTRLDPEEAHFLVKWDSVAIALELLFIGALILGLLSGNQVSQNAQSLLLGGLYTAPFWALVVITGLFVPLILNVVELKKKVKGTRFAPTLILLGGLALRAVLVSAGQVSSYWGI